MSTALQRPVVPTLQPDPSRDDEGTTVSTAPGPQAAASHPDQPPTVEPSRIDRVIRIVRWLIAFGTQLVTAVRDHPAEPLALSMADWFQTFDLGVILRRLTRGLTRAAALEAWLNERAARGLDLREPSLRALSSGRPRSGPPAAPPERDAKAAPWWQDPDHVPTPEEAAAEVRVRPAGVVISGITEDLRVLDCAMDRATWSELKHAINNYGGDYVRLLIRDMRWRFDPNRIPESWRNAPLSGLSTLQESFFEMTHACARPP